MSLVNLGAKASQLGSIIFHKGIMGAWVVTESKEVKKFQNVTLKNFGSHSDKSSNILPYVTLAVAIGSRETELKDFLKTFKKSYLKLVNKN